MTSLEKAPPFLQQVLSEAEDIEVREVSVQNRMRIFSTLDKFLRANEGVGVEEKAFLIRVRKRKEEAPPTPEPLPRDRDFVLRNAALLLQAEDWLLARNLYSYLLKQDIRDRDALKGLGICLTGLGETDSARKCFRALWDLYSAPEALYWLGASYLKEGKDGLASRYFDRITEPDALDADTRFRLHKDRGNCFTRAGRYDEAVESYSRALALVPDSSVIEANLGTLELQRGNLPAAQAHFEKAVRLDPRNSRGHCGLGILARASNRAVDAEKHYEKALEVDPHQRIALLQLLELAHHLESYTKIKEHLTRYLEKHPEDAEIHYLLASVHFKEGNWSPCEESLDRVLALNPHHEKATGLKAELASHKPRP